MTRQPATVNAPPRSHLVEGPRWYRRRIRFLGPLFGLAPMAVLGVAAMVSLGVGENKSSGIVGLILGGSAAPGLLVAGAPFADESRFPIAIVLSAPLWLVIGFVAARRATRHPVATWGDYARELVLLASAVVIGATGALVVATRMIGPSLIF